MSDSSVVFQNWIEEAEALRMWKSLKSQKRRKQGLGRVNIASLYFDLVDLGIKMCELYSMYENEIAENDVKRGFGTVNRDS